MGIEKQDNGVFCVMPWTHIGIKPDGIIRPCSWASHDFRVDNGWYNANDHDISKHQQVESVKQLKQNMLNGVKSPMCVRCYEQEKACGSSKRTMETYTIQKSSAEQILAGHDVPIKELEFRLGNMCNIGCISCDASSSNFFIREINKTNTDANQFEKKFSSKYFNFKDKNLNWYQNKDFWDSIEPHISNLEYLYLAGGEPTIIPENWNFLERIIDLGYADKIHLGVSTNLTNVQPRHIEIYNSFKKTSIYCSIDGYKEVNDYIRYPSKWAAISKNFETLARATKDNVEMKTIPVISIFSIWNLDKLAEYIYYVRTTYNKPIVFSAHTLLYTPNWMSIANLPDEAKQQALEVIKNIESKNYPFANHHMEKIKQYLLNSTPNENIFKEGPEKILPFDIMRNNSWQKVVPELKKYWNYK